MVFFFIDKELVQQHKLALVKITTSIPIEVIKNQFFSLGLMKHKPSY
jgi:hypothetical protein